MKLKDIIGSMASKFAALALALTCVGNVWGAETTTIQNAAGEDITVYVVADGFYQDAAAYSAAKDFYITSKAGFEYFRDLVNGKKSVTDDYMEKGFYSAAGFHGAFYSNNLFVSKTVHLFTDIDLENNVWEPIGYKHHFDLDNDEYYVKTLETAQEATAKTYFYGSFDGHNHVISNINIARMSNNQNFPSKYWKNFGTYGLFGYVCANNNPTFQNITIRNFSGISGENKLTASEYAGDYLGCIVGDAGSNAVTFRNCHIVGDVSVSSSYVAGCIVGIGNVNVIDCSVGATGGTGIDASTFAGGLVGAERCSDTSSLDISGNTVNGVEVTSYRAGSLVGAMALDAKGSCSVTGNDVVDCIVNGDAATVETLLGPTTATTVMTVANNTVRTTLIVETGDLTPAEEITEETKAVDYTVPVTVKDRSGNVVSETTAQEIAVSVADADIANTTLASVKIGDVVAKAIESVGEDATSVTAIEIQVKSTPGEAAQSVTYEVHPEAVVTVSKTGEAATSSTVELSNSDLAANATFTFDLDVSSLNGVNVGDQVKVTHSWEAYTDAASNSVAAGSETTLATVQANRKVRITTTHFSTWTLEGIEIKNDTVAVVFAADGTSTQYTTLAAATAAAYDLSGDVTVQLIVNVAESATICQKAGQNLTVNGDGKTLTGQLIVLGMSSASDATRTETLTIKNFNFTGADSESAFGNGFVYFPNEGTASTYKPSGYTGSDLVHAHNVTIADCSFSATGNDNPSTAKAAAIKSLSTGLDSIKLKNIDASYVHSIQFFSVQEAELDGVTLANTKNGINFNFETAGVATIRNSSICPVGTSAYGIRIQGASTGVINLLGGTVISAANTFELGNDSSTVQTSDGTINVFAGSYKGKYTYVKGYYDIVVTGGIFENDPSTYVPKGYKATALAQSSAEYAAGYRYTIDPLPVVATVTANDVTTNYYDLHEALEAGKASGSVVTLLADVDLNNEPWTPVGTSSSKFCGVFNGNSHTISNLSVTATTDGSGLFGYAQNATISNVVLSAVNVSGAKYCAALVGAPHVCVITDVTIEDATVLSTGTYVGGILGNGYATVRNCVVKGAIGGDNTRYQVGGIAGYLCGIVDKCYVEADISGLTWLGGLVGSCQCDSTSAVTDSTFIGTVTGRGTYYGPGVAGLVGVFLGPGTTISGNYSDSVVTSCGTVIDCPVANYNCDDDGTGVKYFGNTDFSCMDGNSWNISTGAADTTTMREYAGDGAILETEPSVVARDADLVFAASDLASVTPGTLRFATGSQLNSESAVETINAAGEYRAVLNQDGTVTVVPYVAQIGTTKYATLAAAIDAANDGETVKMLADTEIESGISVAKNLTLDLNGKTIAYTSSEKTYVFTVNDGEMIVTDTAENGKIAASNSGRAFLLDGGSLSVEAGTVSAASYAIRNNGEGTVAIKGGTVTVSGNSAIYNDGIGTVEISGGKVVAAYYAVNNRSVGPIAISGGDIDAVKFAILNKSDAEIAISGGNMQSSAQTVLNAANGTVTITGGNILGKKIDGVSDGEAAIYNGNYWGQTSDPPTTGIINISGGTIRAAYRGAIENHTGTLNISGGDISSLNSAIMNFNPGGAVMVSGNAAITADVDPNGTGCAIQSNSSDTDRFEIAGGKILGTIYFDKGTYSITGGIFSDSPTKGVAEGYSVVSNLDPATNEAYPYTILSDNEAQIVRGGAVIQKGTLAEMVAAAESGDTVQLLKDVEIAATTRLDKAGTYTIDGNGYAIAMADGANFGADGALCFGSGGSVNGDDIANKNYVLTNVTLSGFDANEIIRCENCSLTISGCTFTGNTLTERHYDENFRGNNLVLFTHASGAVENCTFTNNTCDKCIDFNSQGGGVNAGAGSLAVAGNLFSDNTISGSGVIFSNGSTGTADSITGNTFSGNAINASAGAVLYISGTVEDISGNLFTGNGVTASGKEAVIVLGSKSTDTSINDNAFVGNVLATGSEKRATVYTGADCDLSGNYWGDGAAPETGTGLDIRIDDGKTPVIAVTGYATAYATVSGVNGATVTVMDFVAQNITTGVKYVTLAEAVAAANAGDTVELLADIDLGTEGLVIADDKDFTLDIGEFNITGAVNGKLITNNGTLVVDGTTGCVYNTDVSDQSHDAILNNGTMTINGGWFGDSDNDKTNANPYNRGAGFRNFGTAVINGGHFTDVDNNWPITAYAYAVISSGENAVLTVNNADVYGKCNGALALISGAATIVTGTFSVDGEYSHYAIYNPGCNATVQGGTFTKVESSASQYLLYASGNGTTTISGGTFASPKTDFISVSGDTASVSISGGIFSETPASYCAVGYEVVANADAATKDAYPWAVAHVAGYIVKKDDGEGYAVIPEVSEKWMTDNDLESDASVAEIEAALNTKDTATNLKKWQAYVLNQTEDPIKIESVENDGVLSTTLVEAKTGTGLDVSYSLVKVNSATGAETDGTASESKTFTLEKADGSLETGLYKVRVHFKPTGDTSASEVTVDSENTVGVLKTTPASSLVVVPVPFKALGGNGEINVSDYIKSGLAIGDTLHVYNGDNYDTWYYNGSVWSKSSTYIAGSDGEQNVSESPEPSTAKLSRGTAAILRRSGSTATPLVFVGDYTGEAEQQITAGWNLVASPSLEPFDPADKFKSGKIQIPTGTAIPKNYTYSAKTGKWGYSGVVKDGDRYLPKRIEVDTLPAGTGFWYISDGDKKVTW